MMNLTETLNTSKRIASLDFIRGVAVLGILVMNIQSFSMPFAAYSNPLNYGDFSGSHYWVWLLSHLFFDQKFMTIFSVLFGVGIYLFSQSVEQREGHSGKRHYLRMLWLFIFGLIHAYFIWYGDILVSYAISGLFVYLFKDAKTKTLILSAVGLISLTSLVVLLQGVALMSINDGTVLTKIIAMWTPPADVLQAEVEAYRSGFAEVFNQRLKQAIEMQSFMPFYLPRVLGLNLLGIVLYRSGFFQRLWPTSRYFIWGGAALALGIAVTYMGAEQNVRQDFYWQFSMAFGFQFNYWGSIFTAFGYMCILMLVANNIETHRVKQALARVGKMAFTNYILQSLICTLIFYGYGLGLFGQLERLQQLFVVLGVWTFLIGYSSWWLSRYSMGPLEWLWRRLTYIRLGA
jgi:uncharacterized protein